MQTIHRKFVAVVEKQLQKKRYIIIDREVDIKDIIINGTYIKVDLLVEKEGRLIPVECGNVQRPKYERMTKLKDKFGDVIHIPYGHKKRELLKKKIFLY